MTQITAPLRSKLTLQYNLFPSCALCMYYASSLPPPADCCRGRLWQPHENLHKIILCHLCLFNWIFLYKFFCKSYLWLQILTCPWQWMKTEFHSISMPIQPNKNFFKSALSFNFSSTYGTAFILNQPLKLVLYLPAIHVHITPYLWNYSLHPKLEFSYLG